MLKDPAYQALGKLGGGLDKNAKILPTVNFLLPTVLAGAASRGRLPPSCQKKRNVFDNGFVLLCDGIAKANSASVVVNFCKRFCFLGVRICK